MRFFDQLIPGGLSPLAAALVVTFGLAALVLVFKLTKSLLKVLLCLIALGLLAGAIAWILAHNP